MSSNVYRFEPSPAAAPGQVEPLEEAMRELSQRVTHNYEERGNLPTRTIGAPGIYSTRRSLGSSPNW